MVLPLKNQVTLGAGAPSALQLMLASIPSRAVRLAGGLVNIGAEAKNVFEMINES
jgi:hypothetical protein